MRYAVPVIDGRLATHFGHCEHFALIDADETSKSIVRKELVASPGHQPGLLPVWLAEEGVSAGAQPGDGQAHLQDTLDEPGLGAPGAG